jgi:hypothetical protein
MRVLTLVCLLLNLCASHAVAHPSPQDDHGSSRGSKCAAGMKECKESLDDFKDAEKFMQLKATVFADLSSGGKSTPKKPQITAGTDAHLGRGAAGISVGYKTIARPNGNSPVPATSAIQPASLKFVAEPNR